MALCSGAQAEFSSMGSGVHASGVHGSGLRRKRVHGLQPGAGPALLTSSYSCAECQGVRILNSHLSFSLVIKMYLSKLVEHILLNILIDL